MTSTSSFPALPPLADLWQTTLGWSPSPLQQAQFQQLYHAILAGNQGLNLTRITAPEAFWEKHLWDSLRGIQPWLTATAAPHQIIDIGTGGGFPGLPVAIALPHSTVTLLDATQKKIRFLQTVAADLGLERVQGMGDRAETLGHQPAHRAAYDWALLRAVAAAPVCAEYALPLLKLHGTAILYRGQWTAADAAALDRALDTLGGRVVATHPVTTPLSQSQHHYLHIEKVAPTPDRFPRAVGVPKQRPL
jgi:16S rRNA (guanine527-N7)-methyltransferase